VQKKLMKRCGRPTPRKELTPRALMPRLARNSMKCLDSLGKRMDAFEKKPVEEDGSDDDPTAKSYPPSSMNPLNDDPTKPRPIGADSRADSIRADAEEIAHFKKVNGVTRAVAADSVLAHIQSDADRAASAWGKSAVHPWDGERIVAYRRRSAREHQAHSAAWKDVDLATLSGQALRNATAEIFRDSVAASSSPETYGETLYKAALDKTPAAWRGRRRDACASLVHGGINSPVEGSGMTIRIRYRILNARLAAGAVSAGQGGGVDQAYDGWRVVSRFELSFSSRLNDALCATG
jgi:hypothetical protein